MGASGRSEAAVFRSAKGVNEMIASNKWLLAALALTATLPLAFSASARPEYGKQPIKLKYNSPFACMSGTVSGTGTGGSAAAAQTNAIAAWSSQIGLASYANWGNAQNKSLTCGGGGGAVSCTAKAQPCTPILNGL